MKKGRKVLFLNCIVVLVVVVFLLLPFGDKPKTAQYDIVFLGDSIIGNFAGSESVTEIVEERLGKSTFNGAFGGTTLSCSDELMWGSVTATQWSLAELADAIAYNDWNSQRSTMQYASFYGDVNMQSLYYFEDRMKELSEVDFSGVEFLIIEHGTNDYNCGRVLDNPEDLYDITTFGGALRHSIKVLKEAYPDMQIVLMSPIYCELGEEREKKCDSWDWGGGTLDEYIQLEKEIAAEYGVLFMDAYTGSGIREDNAKEYLGDGLHLTAEGAEMLSDFVAKYLETIIGE